MSKSASNSRGTGQRTPVGSGQLYDHTSDDPIDVKRQYGGMKHGRDNGHHGHHHSNGNVGGKQFKIKVRDAADSSTLKRKEFKNNSKVNGVEYGLKSARDLNDMDGAVDGHHGSTHQRTNIKNLLRLFDQGEKRQWPQYLKELAEYFRKSSNFPKELHHKRYIVDDICKVFARILTTKLFPDIINELINCMAAFSYALHAKCKDLLNWIFTQYETSTDDSRIVLLRTLTKITENGGKGISDCIGLITEKMCDWIEHEYENPSIVLQISIVLVALSKHPSDKFGKHFFWTAAENIVGRCLDPATIKKEHLFKDLSNILIEFHGYWVAGIDDTKNMLEDFLFDFEKLALPDEESESTVVNEKIFDAKTILKMASFIGTFGAVFRGLDQYATAAMSWTEIETALQRILSHTVHCVQHTKCIEESEILVVNVNDFSCCVISLLDQGSLSEELTIELVNYFYVIEQNFDLQRSAEKLTTTTLTLVITLVQVFNSATPIELINKLLLIGGNVQRLRFSNSRKVLHELFSMHKTLLSTKSVSMVKEVYRHFLVELGVAMSKLTGNENLCPSELAAAAVKDCFDYNEQQALIVVNSVLISLTELISSKNSLVNFSLSPTLFDLLLEMISLSKRVSNGDIITNNLLVMLNSFCANHSHFVSSSNLLQKAKSETTASPFSFTTPSSTYLQRIIEFLNMYTSSSDTAVVVSEKADQLVVEWVESICLMAGPQLSLMIENSPDFRKLVKNTAQFMFAKNAQIQATTCRIITFVCSTCSENLINEDFYRTLNDAIVVNLQHVSKQVRDRHEEMLVQMPTQLLQISGYFKSNAALRAKLITPRDVLVAKQIMMKREPSDLNFNSTIFKNIIAYVLDNEHNERDDWLLRAFLTTVNEESQLKIKSQGSSSSQSIQQHSFAHEQQLVDILKTNCNALNYWACWQLVAYCIVMKLRTPLGKAQDTFVSIETKLKSLFKEEIEKKNENSGSSLRRLKMLLLIMECLDKQLYMAIDGNSTRLYVPPKLSKAFFNTNKNTCCDWFHRQRLMCMQLSLISGDYASVWRHGQQLLKELDHKKMANAAELEQILSLIAYALINLKNPELIAGFMNYAKVLGLKYTWMKPTIEEAAGREQNALKMYKSYLAEQNSKKDKPIEILQDPGKKKNSENFIENFINRRIFDCYEKIGSFQEAVKFSRTCAALPFDINIFSINCDVSHFSKFEDFLDDGVPNGLHRFNDIAISKRADDAVVASNLNFADRLWVVERGLLDTVNDNGIKIAKLNAVRSQISQMIADEVSFNCNQQAINEKLIAASKVASRLEHGASYPEILPEHRSACSSSSIVNVLKWSALSLDQNTSALQLLGAKSARKQENTQLALRQLLAYSKHIVPVVNFSNSGDSSGSQLANLLDNLASGPLEVNAEEKLKIILEGSKLLKSFEVSETRAAIDVLTKTVQQNVALSGENNILISKIYLLLAKYFQLDMKYLEKYEEQALLEFVKRPLTSNNAEALGYDYLIGDLLAASSDSCESYPKAWFCLADWYYRRGRKLIDEQDADGSPTRHAHERQGKDAMQTFDGEKSLFAGDEAAAVTFYKNSATGYLKYLSFTGNARPDSTVQATLRILRLIGKHGPETEEILRKGLETTSVECWHDVIIQLTTKLIHSQQDAFIKSVITSLLNRIAEKHPQLLIYQAISSSLINSRENRLLSNLKSIKNDEVINEKQIADENNDSEEEDADSDEINEKLASNSTFSSVIETISQINPLMVSQTIAFITETRRLTVLPDELWYTTLCTKQGDLMRKVSTLEADLAKFTSNDKSAKLNYMRTRFAGLLGRLVNCLQDTRQLTCETQPQTAYEKWFQLTFNDLIDVTIGAFKNPTDETLLCPKNLVQIYQQLIGTIRKRGTELYSNRSQLILDTISPVLGGLNGSVVPIPGTRCFNSNVTVHRVSKTVSTLPTKTKPKKISFHCSDGELRMFLFKGHEDLHLDERVMQFLNICNKLFGKGQRHAPLKARHYCVVPLGTKSGMIEWVDHGQPLYTFYKRWLLSRNANTKDGEPKREQVFKPSEIFTRKLQSKGITTLKRDEWPTSALTAIYKELSEETPSDLIAKELWCASTNAHEFYTMTQTFTRSNAVMSIIGYILGLGDRHLDNILLDLNTGEIIHVDYNVCFEKGRQLRVAENVPFRLTNNVVNAFGITGIEGVFRISCEKVLKVLRQERETLLTLLDAFVQDPLVDWCSNYNEFAVRSNAAEHRQLSTSRKYASSLLEKIRMKLEGREPDTGRRVSVAEQVDSVIKEASSVESLALMYEGWTSWV